MRESYELEARPAISERLAVQRLVTFAEVTGCRTYIVHLSTLQGLEVAKEAKRKNLELFVETCPQYLLLTQSEVESGRLGPLAKIGPSLRSVTDNGALWRGIREEVIDVIASDHAPRTRAAKMRGLIDIFSAPFGAPGIETLLPVLFDEFYRRNLPLALLSKLISETPAKLFGLFPRKEIIAPGADADIIVFDPHLAWRIQPDVLHTNADYTLWAGEGDHWETRDHPCKRKAGLTGRKVMWGAWVEEVSGAAAILRSKRIKKI